MGAAHKQGVRIQPLVLLIAALLADQRTQPPTITVVAPTGVVRGKSATIEIEGSRLAGTSRILFSDTAVTGKIVGVKEVPQEEEKRTGINSSIDLGERPPKNQVTVEVTAAERAMPGIVRFRLLTPLGTTNTGVLAVSPFAEVMLPAAPPPSSPAANNQPVNLPATILGTVARPGDVKVIRFRATQDQEFVVQVVPGALGSPLEPELTLRDPAGVQISSTHDNIAITPFLDAGVYVLEVRDFQHRGGPRFSYRLNAGAVPYVTAAFPLGYQRNTEAEIALSGANLEDHDRWKAPSRPPGIEMVTVPGALNQARLAVGEWPEIVEREGPRRNDTPQTAQRVPVPVTINGVIAGGLLGGGEVDRDYFAFTARKGQHLVLEVMAERLGSPLDSVIEVLDRQGRPIERAVVRAVAETAVALRDHESTNGSIRILSYAPFHVNDYLYTGNELLRVTTLPRGPDEDIFLVTSRGRRLGYMDTTPSNLAMNAPVYKAEVLPPGSQPPPNGLPVTRLYYRNDDAQGIGPTRDSLVHFTAPEAGEYLVRIADSRGMEDDRFAYRLTIREEHPDFTLIASPSNPNVPRGGSVVVQVTALRQEGFDEPIQVRMEGLPAGVNAAPASIPPGQDTTWIQVHADADAEISRPADIHVVGFAGPLMHEAEAGDRLRVLALAPAPDVKVSLSPATLTLRAGEKTKVQVRVERANGFAGRVPVDIRNLPPGVRIPDIGLNGVLVTEQETSRWFEVVAEDWAQPIEQPIYAVGRVETRSPVTAAYASPPLALKITGR